MRFPGPGRIWATAWHWIQVSPHPRPFFAFHDPNIFRRVWASYTGQYLSFGIIWRFVVLKFRLWVFNEIPQKGCLISGPCMLSEGTRRGSVPLLVVLVLTAWWRWHLPSVFTAKKDYVSIWIAADTLILCQLSLVSSLANLADTVIIYNRATGFSPGKKWFSTPIIPFILINWNATTRKREQRFLNLSAQWFHWNY